MNKKILVNIYIIKIKMRETSFFIRILIVKRCKPKPSINIGDNSIKIFL